MLPLQPLAGVRRAHTAARPQQPAQVSSAGVWMQSSELALLVWIPSEKLSSSEEQNHYTQQTSTFAFDVADVAAVD